MVAPIWQFWVMLTLFGLGFILNTLALGLFAMAPDGISRFRAEAAKKKENSFIRQTARTFFALFGMYLSYSLYSWNPGILGLGIVIVHWASVIIGYIHGTVKSGNNKTEYSVWENLFGFFYTLGMIISLAVFGASCL